LPGSLGVIQWSDFEAGQPGLARAGAELLYHYGVGLAFLATVRTRWRAAAASDVPAAHRDRAVRSHRPIAKQKDPHRDGRYAMHSFPLDENEDAFYLSGAASYVSDRQVLGRLARQFTDERSDLAGSPPGEEQHVFESHVQTAMLPGRPAMAIRARNTPSGTHPAHDRAKVDVAACCGEQAPRAPHCITARREAGK
jgi:hypothetical protein